MKTIVLSVFTFCMLFLSPKYSTAQNNGTKQLEINTKIEYVNKLIWHYNYNIKSIRNHQNELDIWFQNLDRNTNQMPVFQHISYSGSKVQIDTESRTKKDLFNYDYQLDRIEKQILEFNLNCKKLQNLNFSTKSLNDQKLYLENVFSIISSIQNQSYELAEITYDFSRACAVNYKNDVYPKELSKVKNVVAQSKNLILALRDNNIAITKEYLGLLNASLSTMKNTTNVKEIYLISKSKLSLEELQGVIVDIYKKAFTIAAIGELYLQSTFQKEEVGILLQQAITKFNEAEGKMGCASAFNTMLKFSESELMYYLEEPNTLNAIRINPPNKTIEINTNILASNTGSKIEKPISQNKVNQEKPAVVEKPIVVEKIIPEAKQEEIKLVEKQETKENFDEKNLNSLAGSLATHLIILLDVSVSMKQSNKLPIIKKSISHFLNIMRNNDKISLIAYSGSAQVLVSGATNKDKNSILDTLSKVKSSGGSDLYNALKAAYTIGGKNFIPNGNNKIIIASDGIFGVDYSTKKMVAEKVLDQFSLSVFHYSTPNEETNLKTLKELAQLGQGTYNVIYDNQQAIEAMMKEIKKQDFSKR